MKRESSKSAARYRWVILGLTVVAQMSNALSAQAVAPLAPLFQPELGLSKAEVGVFSSAAFMGAWGVLLAAGWLTDRFGVRRTMPMGQIVTGALALGMSAVGSFAQAVAVMLAVGVGRGLVVPGVAKGVMDWFPPSTRATALGVNQAAVSVSGILTAASLPAVALVVGWRAAIALVGLAILLGGLLTVVLYREPERKRESLRGPEGRAGLAEVLRQRKLWVVGALGPMLAGVQFALVTYLALYFEEVVLPPVIPDRSARIVAAGGFLALSHAGGFFARVFWGVISDRFFQARRSVVLVVVSALSALACLALGALGPHHPWWLLLVVVFTGGAATMAWQGLYLAIAGETAGPRHAGLGVGLCMTCTQIGFVAGAPLFGLILDLTDSYQIGWAFLALMSAASALLSALVAMREGPSLRPTT